MKAAATDRRDIGRRCRVAPALLLLILGPAQARAGQRREPQPPSAAPKAIGPTTPAATNEAVPVFRRTGDVREQEGRRQAGGDADAAAAERGRSRPCCSSPAPARRTGTRRSVGHKPFLVLADYLTRRGVAVLRADDRGVGNRPAISSPPQRRLRRGRPAGVDYLKQRKEVQSRQIGLIGHSEGGLIAPMLAAQIGATSPSSSCWPGKGSRARRSSTCRADDSQGAGGEHGATGERQRDLQTRLFALVKAKTDPDVWTESPRDHRRGGGEAPRGQKEGAAMRRPGCNAQIQMMKSPWLRVLHHLRPAAERCGKVQCPVLALVGSKDLQVDPEGQPAGDRTGTAGGRQQGLHRQGAVRDLNHLFQTCTTGEIAEYAKIEETIAPAVLETDHRLDCQANRPRRKTVSLSSDQMTLMCGGKVWGRYSSAILQTGLPRMVAF